MPVIGESLQTQRCHFIVEETRCLTLNANDSWDENNIGKVKHCVARPNTLSTAVSQYMLLTYYNYCVIYVHQ